jgi:hypothetical protein
VRDAGTAPWLDADQYDGRDRSVYLGSLRICPLSTLAGSVHHKLEKRYSTALMCSVQRQASALAFNASNSPWLMVPESNSALALVICSAGDGRAPATCLM